MRFPLGETFFKAPLRRGGGAHPSPRAFHQGCGLPEISPEPLNVAVVSGSFSHDPCPGTWASPVHRAHAAAHQPRGASPETGRRSNPDGASGWRLPPGTTVCAVRTRDLNAPTVSRDGASLPGPQALSAGWARPSSRAKHCASVSHTKHWQRATQQGTVKAGSTRQCFTPRLKVDFVYRVTATGMKRDRPPPRRPSRCPRLSPWPSRARAGSHIVRRRRGLCEDGTVGRAVRTSHREGSRRRPWTSRPGSPRSRRGSPDASPFETPKEVSVSGLQPPGPQARPQDTTPGLRRRDVSKAFGRRCPRVGGRLSRVRWTTLIRRCLLLPGLDDKVTEYPVLDGESQIRARTEFPA